MKPAIQKIKEMIVLISHHPLYIKYNIFLVPTLSILGALLIITFITAPQVFKLIELRTQTEELKSKESPYQEKIRTLESINIEEYKTYLEDLLLYLPADKDIPGAISSVFDLVSKSGMQIENVSLGSAPADSKSNYLAISIDVTGNSEQLKSLITQSYKGSRIMRIEGISINNSNSNNITAVIDLVIFYTPLDANSNSNADQKVNLLTEDDKKLLLEIETYIQSAKNASQPQIIDAETGKTDPFN